MNATIEASRKREGGRARAQWETIPMSSLFGDPPPQIGGLCIPRRGSAYLKHDDALIGGVVRCKRCGRKTEEER